MGEGVVGKIPEKGRPMELGTLTGELQQKRWLVDGPLLGLEPSRMALR